MAPLVWLVTGTTSGIGTALVNQIIERGDKVIASGRKVGQRLGHLKSDNVALLELDVSAKKEAVDAAIQKAWGIFGHIDVLMNNAGMSAMKSAEEADESLINTIFQVNLFGPMRITQSILPFFRAQGHGRIAFTSSSTAWFVLPFMTHYSASKAALSIYVDGLQKEVRSQGIQCVSFECGGFPTQLGQPRDSAQEGFGTTGPAIAEYQELFGELVGMFAADPMAHMPGDLTRAAIRMVEIVTREGMAKGKPWPVRVAIGSDGMTSIKHRCEEQLELLEGWKDVSCSTDRDGVVFPNAEEMLRFRSVLEK